MQRENRSQHVEHQAAWAWDTNHSVHISSGWSTTTAGLLWFCALVWSEKLGYQFDFSFPFSWTSLSRKQPALDVAVPTQSLPSSPAVWFLFFFASTWVIKTTVHRILCSPGTPPWSLKWRDGWTWRGKCGDVSVVLCICRRLVGFCSILKSWAHNVHVLASCSNIECVINFKSNWGWIFCGFIYQIKDWLWHSAFILSAKCKLTGFVNCQERKII